MRIKAIRGFVLKGGKTHAAGDVLDVDIAVATELLSSNKAVRVGEAAPAPAGPMTTETAPAVVSGKRAKKETTNVTG